MRTAKAKRKTKRRAAKARQPSISIDNPPTGYTMSIKELAELDGSSRNTAYAAVAAGRYPSIRHGRNIRVLTLPALQIVRGERPRGGVVDHPPDSAAKKGRRATKKKRAAKSKPAAKKGEAAPAPVTP